MTIAAPVAVDDVAERMGVSVDELRKTAKYCGIAVQRDWNGREVVRDYDAQRLVNGEAVREVNHSRNECSLNAQAHDWYRERSRVRREAMQKFRDAAKRKSRNRSASDIEREASEVGRAAAVRFERATSPELAKRVSFSYTK